MPIVTINYDKCKGIDCAECVDVCPMEVLVLEGDKVEIVDLKTAVSVKFVWMSVLKNVSMLKMMIKFI